MQNIAVMQSHVFFEKKQKKKFYRQPRKESVKVEILKTNQLAAQLNLDDISNIKQMMFIWELKLQIQIYFRGFTMHMDIAGDMFI